MRGPFDWVREPAQPVLLVALSLALLVLSAWLSRVGAPLVTDVAPHGIVSYELARSAARAGAILRAWSAQAHAAAMFSLGLDFLYLLVYPAWFSLAALRTARTLGPGWRRAGWGVAWLAWLAAPLDATENLALVRQLEHGPSSAASALAWACAVPKFALVAGAAAFVLLAGARRLLARRTPSGTAVPQ